MTAQLECKPGVKWEVVPEIEAAQDTIARVYAEARAKAVCTSAHDGKHSKGSAHRQGDPKAKAHAIDLRITTLFRNVSIYNAKEWFERVLMFAHDLSIALEDHLKKTKTPGRFDVVLEDDHIHLEFSPKGATPNIKGFNPKQFVYTTKEVKGYLA